MNILTCPYKSPRGSIIIPIPRRNGGSEGRNDLCRASCTAGKGDNQGLEPGLIDSRAQIYCLHHIVHCSNDTLIIQSDSGTPLWKLLSEPVHSILVNIHFWTSAPCGALQRVYTNSILAFQRLPTLVGEMEADGAYSTTRETRQSVTTEAPKMMGVWASETLFQNYPNYC